MENIWILAQTESQQATQTITAEPVNSDSEQVMTTTTTASDGNSPSGQTTTQKAPGSQWIFLVLMFVVMYLLLFRGPRKKQQEHKKMVQSLQKNDKVRTIGGIIGTVVDIKDDQITLKVDEANNTKIKVLPSAIGNNISKEN